MQALRATKSTKKMKKFFIGALQGFVFFRVNPSFPDLWDSRSNRIQVYPGEDSIGYTNTENTERHRYGRQRF